MDVVSVMAACFDCNQRIYLECADGFESKVLSMYVITNIDKHFAPYAAITVLWRHILTVIKGST
jgi:hypothetical protein